MPPEIARNPLNLLGKSPEELRAFLQDMGEPAYRGGQIYHALYAERRSNFGAMTNLPAALRERLTREAAIDLPKIVRTYRSDDGTLRYVLSLGTAAESENPNAKAATIETVFMPEENRQTICISTQAGCAVDCHFCLTATLGLIRNLTAGELPFEKPDPSRVEEFRRILTEKNVRAFVRYSRGQDVMAACGQLALLESTGGLGSSTLSQISPATF